MHDDAAHKTAGSPHSRTGVAFAAALIGLGIALRLVFLDADPAYYLWSGYITDEGRWTEGARGLILFGAPDLAIGQSRIHFILAPLFQALTAFSFATFGVGFASARLVSALCGGALLIAAFLFLRRRVSQESLLLAMLVLALQPDLLFLSRVAIPEMLAMLFEFLAFAALVSEPRSTRRALAAGLVTGLAVAAKGTTAPIAAIFAVVILVVHRRADPVSRWRKVGAYVAGLLGPAVASLAVLAVLSGPELSDQFGGAASLLTAFVTPNTPYGILSLLFYTGVAPALNLLLLPAWAVAGLLLAEGRLPPTRLAAVYLGSATWIGGWLIVSSALAYFPERYVLHVLVPLAVNLGVGVTLLQRSSAPFEPESLLARPGTRRWMVVMWLALPMAVLSCPVLIALASVAGTNLDTLGIHLAMIGILDAGLAWMTLRSRHPGRVALDTVALALLVATLWFIANQTIDFDGGFWTATGRNSLVEWALILCGATGFLAMARARPGRARRAVMTGCVGMIAGMWLYSTGAGIESRRYTIAHASVDLGALVENGTLVGTQSAASMFLANDLRYTERLNSDPLPDVVVVAFDPIDARLSDHYRLVRQYDLHLGDAYLERNPIDNRLRVYRRVR